MKTLETNLTRIGNAWSIKLPAALIHKHRLEHGVLVEEREGEIVLKPKKVPRKLSWEETAQQMAASTEDWSDWERVSDGWH